MNRIKLPTDVCLPDQAWRSWAAVGQSGPRIAATQPSGPRNQLDLVWRHLPRSPSRTTYCATQRKDHGGHGLVVMGVTGLESLEHWEREEGKFPLGTSGGPTLLGALKRGVGKTVSKQGVAPNLLGTGALLTLRS